MKNPFASKILRLFAIPVLAVSVFIACSDDPVTADADPTIVEVAAGNPDFSILVSLLQQTGLDVPLSSGEFTVFAPTNAAFGNLPEGTLESLTDEQAATILQYHVIGAVVPSTALQPTQSPETLTGEEIFITVDGGVTVNGNAQVVIADVEASNGVIHAIDNVLMPNEFLDIVGIVSKNYNLTSLVGAVLTADLAGVLTTEGPFTVFAPTNAAFQEIASTVAGLSDSQLAEVLTYHVIGGASVASSDLQPTQTVETVNGQDITITVDNNGAFVNGDSEIVQVDLTGTNGVIHIIDTVLIPDFD